jgi:hypothetical protein
VRRWLRPVAVGAVLALAGTAAAAESVLLSDGRGAPVPPGQPPTAETAYRAAGPPSSRTLVCPDLGAAGQVGTTVDLARSGAGGQVVATLVAEVPPGADGSGAGAGPAAAGTGQSGASVGAESRWWPPGGPVLSGQERRAVLVVPGVRLPPAARPAPDLSVLAGVPAADGPALSALKTQADLRTLAALAPADRAAVATLAAPVDLSALAGLSAAERADVTRLAVSSSRPVLLRGGGVAQLSAAVTAPGGMAGPVRALCAPTDGTAWFAGPATAGRRDPLLFVVNAGAGRARVDVRVLAPGQAPSVVELTVPPGRTVSQRVAAIAPEAAATAVGVEARAGRVASWLLDRPAGGASWDLAPVPAAAAPGRSVLLGPLVAPPGDGAAATTLVLAAPAGDAAVRVRLVTASGGVVSPDGLAGVPVPGGETITVPIALPRAEGAAVLVDATGPAPVVAALGLPSGAPAAAGLASSAGTAAPGDGVWVAGVPTSAAGGGLGQAPVPSLDVPPLPAGAAGALVLAAPQAMGTIRLDGRPLTVPAGGTVTVELPAGYAGGQLDVVTGPVAAAEVLGTPSGQPADLPEPEVTELPPTRTVSSVLPLLPADPLGPAAGSRTRPPADAPRGQAGTATWLVLGPVARQAGAGACGASRQPEERSPGRAAKTRPVPRRVTVAGAVSRAAWPRASRSDAPPAAAAGPVVPVVSTSTAPSTASRTAGWRRVTSPPAQIASASTKSSTGTGQ